MKKLWLAGIILITGRLFAWTAVYGGADDDWGFAGCELRDGNYAFTGYTSSFGRGGTDIFWLKTDRYGNELDFKTFGCEFEDTATLIVPTSDGGCVILGRTRCPADDSGWVNLCLIKLDANGDSLWAINYQRIGIDEEAFIAETSDRGFVIGCNHYDPFDTVDTVMHDTVWSGIPLKFRILRTDSCGEQLWDRYYMSRYFVLKGFSIAETPAGNFFVTGSRNTSIPSYKPADVWVMKIDQEGNSIWSITFGGEVIDEGYSVQAMYDTCCIITGRTQSFGSGGMDLWLLKVAEFRYEEYFLVNTDWTKCFGGISNEEGKSVIFLDDGGFAIGGCTDSYGAGRSDFWLIRTDSTGKKLWDRTYGGEGKDICEDMRRTSDGGFLLTGYSSSFGSGDKDIWVVKVDSLGMSVGEEPDEPVRTDWHAVNSIGSEIRFIYNNSGKGFHANVYDALGRKIDELHACESSGQITWGKGIPSGVYFIRTESAASASTHRVILLE